MQNWLQFGDIRFVSDLLHLAGVVTCFVHVHCPKSAAVVAAVQSLTASKSESRGSGQV